MPTEFRARATGRLVLVSAAWYGGVSMAFGIFLALVAPSLRSWLMLAVWTGISLLSTLVLLAFTLGLARYQEVRLAGDTLTLVHRYRPEHRLLSRTGLCRIRPLSSKFGPGYAFYDSDGNKTTLWSIGFAEGDWETISREVLGWSGPPTRRN